MRNSAIDASGPDQRVRRSRRWILVLVLVLVLAPMVLFLSWHRAASRRLEARLAVIRARGEPLWFSDLAPVPLDPSVDGTSLFFKAASTMKPPSVDFRIRVTADPLVIEGDNSLLSRELEANREALTLARAAGLKGRAHIPIDYATLRPITTRIDLTTHWRNLAYLFAGRVVVAIAENDQALAVQTVEDLLRWPELLRDEPILTIQLIRVRIGLMGLGLLNHVLTHFDLTSEQFMALDARLAAMEEGFRLTQAVLAERAVFYTTVRHLPENSEVILEPSTAPTFRFLGSALMDANLLEDAEFGLHIIGDMARTIDVTGPAGDEAAREIKECIEQSPRRFVMTRVLSPMFHAAREIGMQYRQKLAIERLAMRVDWCLAERGSLPASMADLEDDFAATMRADVYTGQPLVYKTLFDGFAIYSKGANGVDEGGVIAADKEEFGTKVEFHYPTPGKALTP